jgi:hypothetical protein
MMVAERIGVVSQVVRKLQERRWSIPNPGKYLEIARLNGNTEFDC